MKDVYYPQIGHDSVPYIMCVSLEWGNSGIRAIIFLDFDDLVPTTFRSIRAVRFNYICTLLNLWIFGI